jgi:hypothetical protein
MKMQRLVNRGMENTNPPKNPWNSSDVAISTGKDKISVDIMTGIMNHDALILDPGNGLLQIFIV